MADETERDRPTRRQLTKAVRETFLDHLAATAHVVDAAAAAGFSVQAFYARRRRDEAFAQEWRAALLTGYDRIEAALMRKALGLRDHAPVVDSAATGTLPAEGEIDVNIALHLLGRHRPTVEKVARDAKERAFRASRDAAAATLLSKLKAHAKLPETRAKAAAIRDSEA